MNSKRWSASGCRREGGAAHGAGRGFTLVELMVVLAVLGVMASIFVPYAQRVRESDRRVRCYDNLMRLSAALRDYAALNGHNYPATRAEPRRAGYTCFTGADRPAAVEPNDVTASLWLLVRLRLASPRDFICPSTDDRADPAVSPAGRGNFASPTALSYSYACPFSTAAGYRLNDTRPPEFALIADRGPGPDAASARSDAGPLDLSTANSPNHGRSGQNVLYADGHAEFCPTPYCGKDDDNIYTALSRRPSGSATTAPATAIRNARGVADRCVGPAWEADSFLVPSAADACATASSPAPESGSQDRPRAASSVRR